MPTTIKNTVFIWLEVVLMLVVNLAVMFALLFLNSPKFGKFIQPLFISLFITSTICHRNHNYTSFFFMFLFTIFDSLIPESHKSNGQKDLSEQENDDNQEGQAETIEANQDVQADATEQNQSFFEKLGSINLVTAFLILFVCFSYVDTAINSNRSYRYNYDDNKIVINQLFYRLFLYATYQFIYGVFVLNDEPPRWLYLFYMIPLAVLYPISAFCAYYVAATNYQFHFLAVPYEYMRSALQMFYTFKMLQQFIQNCKGEGELKNKIINIVIYAIGFLWVCFLLGIDRMNN